MYSVTADGTPLFQSSDRALVRHMFRQYRTLYAWDKQSVRVKVKRVHQ
jgi:hypothetical protein